MVTKNKHNVTAYFEPELKADVKELADASGRSFARQVEWIVKDWWRQRERKKQEEDVLAELTF
jgi:hypothetical protein